MLTNYIQQLAPWTPDPESQNRLTEEHVRFLKGEVALLQYDLDRLSATYGLFLILYSLLCGVAGIMGSVVSLANHEAKFLEGGWSWALLSFSLLLVPFIALLYANQYFSELKRAMELSWMKNDKMKGAIEVLNATFTPW
jgi:hypothetical protein